MRLIIVVLGRLISVGLIKQGHLFYLMCSRFYYLCILHVIYSHKFISIILFVITFYVHYCGYILLIFCYYSLESIDISLEAMKPYDYSCKGYNWPNQRLCAPHQI